ncbi:tyrosine-type recombinase/integrase [Actinomadura kijaniata]|uniref:tyrosine-type recombinase/integrase n=1 Tax=Actinomadura kijaniata TaxID=46161 RepID=UPI000835613D|nr:tyrosine-type recombinase/integrase [Actinomadura kijaniata]
MRIGNVQFWKTQCRPNRRKPYQVRWVVDGKTFSASYLTSTLAEHFRNQLIAAARAGEHFDVDNEGLPASLRPKPKAMTWYELGRVHTAMKWPEAAGNSRRNLVSGHVKITLALLSDRSGAPSERRLRDALRHWAFRPLQGREVPEEQAGVLEWVAERSRPVTDLLDLDALRALLHSLGTKDNGTPAKASTAARYRAVLTSALNYAVERGELEYNPVERLAWRPVTVTRQVDPRVVASPRQVRELLTAVTYVGVWDKQRGPRLLAFFACLYFAALRPEEAVQLRLQDCKLPEAGPGLIQLSAATTRAGSAWTDDGSKHETRGLKHRATDDGRDVPIPPELVRILQWHIATFGTADDGRLFPGPHGQALDSTRYLDTWHKARRLALPPHLYNSPLAKRPYDLRHAALSLWLNSGVPAPDVAQRAGNTVSVLLQTYARCIYGQEDANTQRIIDALGDGGSPI